MGEVSEVGIGEEGIIPTNERMEFVIPDFGRRENENGVSVSARDGGSDLRFRDRRKRMSPRVHMIRAVLPTATAMAMMVVVLMCLVGEIVEEEMGEMVWMLDSGLRFQAHWEMEKVERS